MRYKLKLTVKATGEVYWCTRAATQEGHRNGGWSVKESYAALLTDEEIERSLSIIPDWETVYTMTKLPEPQKIDQAALDRLEVYRSRALF